MSAHFHRNAQILSRPEFTCRFVRYWKWFTSGLMQSYFRTIHNEELGWLFENCLRNTLDTMVLFVDKPEKTQKILDYIMDNLYGMRDGLTLAGMDNAGEMSAWYVFNALGLCTFSATDPEYLVTVPLFDEVKVEASTGKWLIIKNDGVGRNLKSMKVNEKAIANYFVPTVFLSMVAPFQLKPNNFLLTDNKLIVREQGLVKKRTPLVSF